MERMVDNQNNGNKDNFAGKVPQPADAPIFSAELKRLIDEAEESRLNLMKQYEFRGFMAFSLGMLSVLGGASGFGWYFFYKFEILNAILCQVIGVIPFYFLHQFKMLPLQKYKREHKTIFMPKLAEALGGFQYKPRGGIKAKVLLPAKILPSFEKYSAEDCLSGAHQGTKIIISEAHMAHSKHRGEYVFDGVFVLLELPGNKFQGHTIVTADSHASRRWKDKRWQGLNPVPIANQRLAAFFEVFSNAPGEAETLAGENVLTQLAELSAEFDNAHVSVAFYEGKYIFMMIPYRVNMFEPSDLYLPVATAAQAQRHKNEIEKIISIIDLLGTYEPKSSLSNAT